MEKGYSWATFAEKYPFEIFEDEILSPLLLTGSMLNC